MNNIKINDEEYKVLSEIYKQESSIINKNYTVNELLNELIKREPNQWKGEEKLRLSNIIVKNLKNEKQLISINSNEEILLRKRGKDVLKNNIIERKIKLIKIDKEIFDKEDLTYGILFELKNNHFLNETDFFKFKKYYTSEIKLYLSKMCNFGLIDNCGQCQGTIKYEISDIGRKFFDINYAPNNLKDDDIILNDKVIIQNSVTNLKGINMEKVIKIIEKIPRITSCEILAKYGFSSDFSKNNSSAFTRFNLYPLVNNDIITKTKKEGKCANSYTIKDCKNFLKTEETHTQCESPNLPKEKIIVNEEIRKKMSKYGIKKQEIIWYINKRIDNEKNKKRDEIESEVIKKKDELKKLNKKLNILECE